MVCLYSRQYVVTHGRFLSGGIILGFPLSCPDLFLCTITLPAVSCDAPPTLSYTALELASRVLLSSKKSAINHTPNSITVWPPGDCTYIHSLTALIIGFFYQATFLLRIYHSGKYKRYCSTSSVWPIQSIRDQVIPRILKGQ
jgi:hypothetical protein